MATEPASLLALKATKDGVELLDKIGALERLSLKLVSNPDKAISKLNVALGELTMGYTAFHNEILALSTLSFEQEDLKDVRARLVRLKDGRLMADLAPLKGSCVRIISIYKRYLTGWFNDVLTKREAQRLELVFIQLSSMDGRFLRGAEALSALAQQHATELLGLLQEKRYSDAALVTAKFERTLAPVRQKLSRNLAMLWVLQERFTKASRAV